MANHMLGTVDIGSRINGMTILNEIHHYVSQQYNQIIRRHYI
jgi:hypothetical protein